MGRTNPDEKRVASVAMLVKLAVIWLLAVSVTATWDAAGQSIEQLPEKKPSPISPQARAHIRQAAAAVGLILVRDVGDPADQKPRPRGSAVIVRKDGVVATNYHVITKDKSDRLYDEIIFNLSAEETSATPASHRFRLKAALINKDRDLALLRIVSDGEGKPISASFIFPTIELGDSRGVQPLDDLAIIGFPEKGGSTVTINTGVIEGKDILEDWIKTDARLIHGNSGGAAVNDEGMLIGIPTKVIADSQMIDTDGDGFPDTVRMYGAVGFLRPAHLVAAMLAQLREPEEKPPIQPSAENSNRPTAQELPQVVSPTAHVIVRGVIRSTFDGKPIAGARVGLIPTGNEDVTAANLLTWGGTNADGQFELNRPVPPGHYTLKAKAIRYEAFTRDVEIDQNAAPLVIELRPQP